VPFDPLREWARRLIVIFFAYIVWGEMTLLLRCLRALVPLLPLLLFPLLVLLLVFHLLVILFQSVHFCQRLEPNYKEKHLQV
jgi:hypothetical protein